MIIIIQLKLKRLLAPLLAVSLAANLYLLYIKQNQDREHRHQNQIQLRSISVFGENLAEKAETFIRLSESEHTKDVQEKRFESWRIVVGEQRSIHSHLANIRPYDMGKLQAQWSLLQYSLNRVDSLLHALTLKFPEQGSYELNAEESEKLKAAITIYKKIHEEVERESDHPVLVIHELTEPMLLIDPNYSIALGLGGDN